jgi:hypothetical protein
MRPSGRGPRAVVPLLSLAFIVAAPLAVVAGALLLGLLFPWEPPETRDAPQEAVVRVVAPEGRTYKLVWDYGVEELGEIRVGRSYEDHAVPAEAGSPEDGFNFLVDRTKNLEGERWGGPLHAVLFVSDGYATCSGSGEGFARVYWQAGRDTGGPLVRAVCGSYRYTGGLSG